MIFNLLDSRITNKTGDNLRKEKKYQFSHIYDIIFNSEMVRSYAWVLTWVSALVYLRGLLSAHLESGQHPLHCKKGKLVLIKKPERDRPFDDFP